MSDHPIEGLMDTAMSNIKSMVDVNTVVGTAVTTPDGTMIIPVSTVSFGFGAGGCDFDSKKSTANPQEKPNFGGGCGGGANVKPIAFLVVGNGTIKLLPVTPEESPVNKIIDLVPDMVDKVNSVVSEVAQKAGKNKEKKKDDEEKDYTVDVAE